MKNSRRTFFKQGLAGALALGSASLPVSAAMTDGVGKAKAKRVVLISLDGICGRISESKNSEFGSLAG